MEYWLYITRLIYYDITSNQGLIKSYAADYGLVQLYEFTDKFVRHVES